MNRDDLVVDAILAAAVETEDNDLYILLKEQFIKIMSKK